MQESRAIFEGAKYCSAKFAALIYSLRHEDQLWLEVKRRAFCLRRYSISQSFGLLLSDYAKRSWHHYHEAAFWLRRCERSLDPTFTVVIK